jgi:glycosyltransferase involved in cell wall biosynthesis
LEISSPRVSILIPVYNRESMVKNAIDSALAQTYTDFEVVVCDNASTDDTWNVCSQYSGDPRVRLFRNQENVGPVRNWRRCLEEARGDFVKLLFSDDIIHPTYLEKAVPLLGRKDVGMVVSDVEIGADPAYTGACVNNGSAAVIMTSRRYLRQSLIKPVLPYSPGAYLLRKASLQQHLLDEIPSPTLSGFWQSGAGTDLVCLMLTARDYKYIAYLPEKLCFFRSHPGSITISESHALLNYYLQARLWFAANYANSGLFAKVRARSWGAYCRRERKFYPYRDVLQKFLFEVPGMGAYESMILLYEGSKLLRCLIRARK